MVQLERVAAAPAECAHGWSPCGVVQRGRAVARQASKRSPIGTHLRTSAATTRSAKAEIAESGYCSEVPLIL